MYNAFLEGIKESYNDAILSQDVAFFLNQAQIQLVNDIVYNRKEKPEIDGMPRTITEDSLYSAENIANLERRVTANTNAQGFWPKPSNYLYVAAVRAGREVDDCGTLSYSKVPFMRKNEIDAYQNNRFKRPTWEDATLPRSYWYRPRYINLTTSTGVDGMLLYPNRQYSLEIDYLKYPETIVVKSPAAELAEYGALSNYVAQVADQNSDLAVILHPEIVRRAILLFSRSRTNVEVMPIDVTLIDTNKN
jgi:hypothetical protein